ncbi:MAG: serine/threonine protein kinase [Candidatus Aquicultorales bacterium]
MHTVDRFRVISEIARGGQGRILLCYDPKEERQVVLKMLDLREAGTRAFVGEAHALMRLEHPNIVRLFGFRQCLNEKAYLVMEYVDGKSLADKLRSEGALSVEETIRVALDIACALHAAHRSGLVHKDVKPSNILLTKTGRAKLSDFGISSPVGAGTTAGRMGSARYMAPELAIDMENAGFRSDLYALGVTMYEALTGCPPFNAEGPTAIMRLHLFKKPIPPKALRKETPEWLDGLILKLLSKRADDRPAGVNELIVALRSRSMPADPSPIPGAAAGDRTVRRRLNRAPMLAWAGATSAAAIVLVGAYLGVTAESPRPIAYPVTSESEPVEKHSQASVTVPALAGLTVNEAEDVLSDRGLKLGRIDYSSSGRYAGIVMGQSVKPGTRVKTGAVISLIVVGDKPYPARGGIRTGLHGNP